MTDPAFHHRVQVGLNLLERGEQDKAGQLFRELLEAHPKDAGLWNLLGVAEYDAGRLDEARKIYERALALDRRHPEYNVNLGCVELRLGHAEEAARRFRVALAVQPAHAYALLNLGHALHDMGDYRQAESAYRRTMQRDAGNSEAVCGLCSALQTQGRVEEAERCYREGLARLPAAGDLHVSFGHFLLERARFTEGWREYQWRHVRWDMLTSSGMQFWTLPSSPWGSQLDDMRFELFAEQGIGDILFFLRFAAALRHRGAVTRLYLPDRMEGIVGRAGCVDELRDLVEAPPLTRHSILLGDLPFMLGMHNAAETPQPLPLTPLAASLEAMRLRLAACGPAPYIGLTWRAGAELGKDFRVLRKEIPLNLLAGAMAAIPGTLIGLQRNPKPGEVARCAELTGRPVHDFSDANADLEDALALMDCVDEIVGVSNTNVHLRAGLGKTGRILLPHPAEWRWMAAGDESPWFRGFSVYRQGAEGDWTDAIGRLADDLHQRFV